MILIGYDGSPDAKAAIRRAGVLMPGATATVVTIWEPVGKVPAVLGPIVAHAQIGDDDRAAATIAERCAAEGAQLAEEAGLRATPEPVAWHSGIAEGLMQQAERLDVDAIVLGCRGLSAVGSLLLGSVSHEVVQHADRAVLVVPSDVAAGRRHKHRREHSLA